VATVAFPNLFGGPQLAAEDPGYYGPMVPNYAEGNSDTVGLAVAALAPLGLLGLRRRRDGPRTRRLVVFALGLVGAEGLALYTRVAGHVWSHVPLLGHTDLNRSQDVGLLGVAVLVAVGIDVVTRTAPTGTATLPGIAVPSDQGGLPAYVRIGVPLSSLAVVTVVSGGIALRLRHHVAARGGTVARTGPIAVDNAVFEVVAALVVVAVVLALVAAKEGRGRGLLAAALVVAVAASAAIPLRSFDPTVPSGAAYPVTPSLAAVRRVVASAPTLWLDGTLPAANTNLWFGLGDVGTYDGLDLRWHDELYDRVLHLPTGGTSPARPETLPACAEGLRVLGVHWVVGATPGALGLRPVDSVDGSTVSPVPGGGTYQLLGASTVIDDDDRALSTVASCGFRPDRTLVLDGGSSVPLPVAPPTVRPRRSGPVPGAVQVLDERASTVRLRVSVPRSSWLLIRHSWAPGWTATIDGRAVTVRRADVAFQAVDVPAGSHRVVLTGHPVCGPGSRSPWPHCWSNWAWWRRCSSGGAGGCGTAGRLGDLIPSGRDRLLGGATVCSGRRTACSGRRTAWSGRVPPRSGQVVDAVTQHGEELAEIPAPGPAGLLELGQLAGQAVGIGGVPGAENGPQPQQLRLGGNQPGPQSLRVPSGDLRRWAGPPIAPGVTHRRPRSGGERGGAPGG
jgi:hypothetical protein